MEAFRKSTKVGRSPKDKEKEVWKGIIGEMRNGFRDVMREMKEYERK